MVEEYEERWREVEASIGRATVVWSRLEFFIGMTFRAALSDCPPALSAHLARSLSTSALLDALKVTAKDYSSRESSAITTWVTECTRLSKVRNELLHGSYADQSDGAAWHPTIIRTSRKAGGTAPGHLEFERFDAATVATFVGDCGAAIKALGTLPVQLSGWVNNVDEQPDS